MKTPGTGILRASQFTLPGQIRLRDSEVYFLQNPRMSHSEGGLVMNKPYVGFYKTTSTSGEPLLQALLSQGPQKENAGFLFMTAQCRRIHVAKVTLRLTLHVTFKELHVRVKKLCETLHVTF